LTNNFVDCFTSFVANLISHKNQSCHLLPDALKVNGVLKIAGQLSEKWQRHFVIPENFLWFKARIRIRVRAWASAEKNL